VAPEDQEALAAIEKLIKRKIERVLVGGFEPNAGTAATMMGGERRRDARPQPRPQQHSRDRDRDRGPRQQHHSSAPARPQQQPKHSDPIFSKPYEPGTAPAAPKAQEPASTSKRRERPVAALLGGLKR
jgi:hypothetical protein